MIVDDITRGIEIGIMIVDGITMRIATAATGAGMTMTRAN